MALVRPGASLTRLQEPGPTSTDCLEGAALEQGSVEVAVLGSISLEQQIAGCEAVVHTACSYGRGNESAADIQAANVTFATSLLEAAQHAACSTFLYCDTALAAKVTPYAASKAEFRTTLRSARAPTCRVALRMEHFYGPGEGESKFVSFVLRSLLKKRPHLPLTEGTQERDFVFVDDIINAILLLLASALDRAPLTRRSFKSQALVPGFHEIFLGSGKGITIRALVEKIAALVPSNSTHLGFGEVPLRANEVMRSVSSSESLRALGWEPTISLDEGLKRTVAAEQRELNGR